MTKTFDAQFRPGRQRATAIAKTCAANIIKVTDEEFGRFVEICKDETRKPSPRVLTAAKRLDNQA